MDRLNVNARLRETHIEFKLLINVLNISKKDAYDPGLASRTLRYFSKRIFFVNIVFVKIFCTMTCLKTKNTKCS